MKYLDVDGIKRAFADHLIKYRDYSESEAVIAVSDFPNPYELPYLDEEFICEEEIDGIEYNKYASVTNLWKCGIYDMPTFRFYTYYATEDIPNHKVGEYISARKLYQVDDLDDGDFPQENNPDIDMEDYEGYPFAMEVVNGEIVSMTPDFQIFLRKKLMSFLDMDENELIDLLKIIESGEEPDDESIYDKIGYDIEYLPEILGYDSESETFEPVGIGMLESVYGWETKELLEALEIPMQEDTWNEPHGQGSYGVIFIDEGYDE